MYVNWKAERREGGWSQLIGWVGCHCRAYNVSRVNKMHKTYINWRLFVFFLSYKLKYLTPNAALYMALGNANWWKNSRLKLKAKYLEENTKPTAMFSVVYYNLYYISSLMYGPCFGLNYFSFFWCNHRTWSMLLAFQFSSSSITYTCQRANNNLDIWRKYSYHCWSLADLNAHCLLTLAYNLSTIP